MPGLLAVALWACGEPDGEALPPDASFDGAGETGSDGAVQPSCVPKTCDQLGAECGSVPDGCGGKVSCGTCAGGETCGGGGPNLCGTAACRPKSCPALGASCGYVSDGCSEAIDCGGCPVPETCGGGGKANQCGCSPRTCGQLGASCGKAPDGCGG
ncbi:MAG: tryptophan synthase alpha chain, partial [Deltaproteobacteria bacterium HGW-Deltaproteobacteria-20]